MCVAGGCLELDCDRLPVVCGLFQGRFLPAVVDSKRTREETALSQPAPGTHNQHLPPSLHSAPALRCRLFMDNEIEIYGRRISALIHHGRAGKTLPLSRQPSPFQIHCEGINSGVIQRHLISSMCGQSCACLHVWRCKLVSP